MSSEQLDNRKKQRAKSTESLDRIYTFCLRKGRTSPANTKDEKAVKKTDDKALFDDMKPKTNANGLLYAKVEDVK